MAGNADCDRRGMKGAATTPKNGFGLPLPFGGGKERKSKNSCTGSRKLLVCGKSPLMQGNK